MKKLAISISLLFASLLLIFGIALVLLPQIINTHSFKQELIDTVKRQSGLTLALEGDFSLSLWPSLRLESGNLSLSQPPSIEAKQALVQADALVIELKLKTLLRRQIAIKTLQLDGAQLHYVADMRGNTSFDSFTDSEPSKNSGALSDSKEPDSNEPNSGSTTTPLSLLVDGLSLQNARLTIENQAENTVNIIDNIQLVVGALAIEEPIPLSLSASLNLHGQEPFSINLDSQLRWLESEKILSAESTALRAETKHIVKELRLNSAKTTLNLAEKRIDMPFTLQSSASNLKLTGNVIATNWDKQLLLKGQVESNNFNPSSLIDSLNLDYQSQDTKVLKSLSFSSQFSGSKSGIFLHDLITKLDDSQLRGDLAVMNFEQPQYRFDLTLDQLNLDRYLPPPQNKTAANTEKNNTKNGKTSVFSLPIALLHGVNANGMLSAKQLTIQGAKIDTLSVKVTTKNREMTLTPQLSFYKGSGKGTLLFSDTQPATLSSKLQFNGIDLGALLQDTNLSDQLSGRGDMGIDLLMYDQNHTASQGDTGRITLAIEDGELKGIDIKKILDNTQKFIDTLRGKMANDSNTSNESTEGKSSVDDKTRFTAMTASFNLKNNILKNNDLDMKGPAFRVSGKGEIKLVPQSLNYLSNIAFVDTNTGQGGKDQADLNSIIVPVKFYGDLTSPSYRINTRELIKQNTQKEVDKKKEELKEKLKEKTLKELGLKNDKKAEEGVKENKKAEDLLKEKLIKELFK